MNKPGPLIDTRSIAWLIQKYFPSPKIECHSTCLNGLVQYIISELLSAYEKNVHVQLFIMHVIYSLPYVFVFWIFLFRISSKQVLFCYHFWIVYFNYIDLMYTCVHAIWMLYSCHIFNIFIFSPNHNCAVSNGNKIVFTCQLYCVFKVMREQ